MVSRFGGVMSPAPAHPPARGHSPRRQYFHRDFTNTERAPLHPIRSAGARRDLERFGRARDFDCTVDGGGEDIRVILHRVCRRQFEERSQFLPRLEKAGRLHIRNETLFRLFGEI